MTLQENVIREQFYALFSRVFIMELDEDTLEKIRLNYLDYFPNLKSWNKFNELSNKLLIEREFNADFTNISLLHLIPYESFYTSDEQMINSGGENKVIQFYNDLDFKVELDVARVLSPDHIGVELEFMNLLISSQIKAINSNDTEAVIEFLKIQKEFLKEHLLKWSPMYLINVKLEAFTPLYHDVAEACLQFLCEDFEYINSKVLSE